MGFYLSAFFMRNAKEEMKKRSTYTTTCYREKWCCLCI